MNATGNKLLLVFLFCSVFFFAVAVLTGNDAPDDSDAAGVPGIDADSRAGSGSPVDSDIDARTDFRIEAEATAIPASASSTAQRDRPENHVVLLSYDLKDAARQYKLKNRLREVSGLAMLEGNRLLAHDDERGMVTEIDYRDGSIAKSFKLGGPRGLVADDLEGIAAAEGRLFLVSSTGRLYEFEEGADGETVPYVRHDTGVGSLYEIEGLAYNPDLRSILMVSKNPRNRQQPELIAIYRWSLDTRRLVEDGHILMEASTLARRIDRNRFQPSGIERHPVTGNYFIVAARQRAVAEITPQGAVIAVIELKAGRHRQAEGITFASDNTMVIADEGAGKRATLSFYPVAEER